MWQVCQRSKKQLLLPELLCNMWVNPLLQPGGAAPFAVHPSSASHHSCLRCTGTVMNTLRPPCSTTAGASRHLTQVRIHCLRDTPLEGSQCLPVQCINIPIRKINVVFLLVLQLVKCYCCERRELAAEDNLQEQNRQREPTGALQRLWDPRETPLFGAEHAAAWTALVELCASPSCLSPPLVPAPAVNKATATPYQHPAQSRVGQTRLAFGF